MLDLCAPGTRICFKYSRKCIELNIEVEEKIIAKLFGIRYAGTQLQFYALLKTFLAETFLEPEMFRGWLPLSFSSFFLFCFFVLIPYSLLNIIATANLFLSPEQRL